MRHERLSGRLPLLRAFRLGQLSDALSAVGALARAAFPPNAPALHQSPRAGVILAQIAELPFGSLDDLLMGHPALILAPHPDDESLGCGGLIAEACDRQLPPVVVVLTDGSMSHPGSRTHPPERLRALRQDETRAALAALGLPQDRLHFLDLPDGRAPRDGHAMETAAARLAGLAHSYGVGTIFSTWEHDPHPDHVAAHVIARTAAGHVGARLVSYPVWGWTIAARTRLPVESVSGLRLNIARHLPAKRRAIAAHATQHGGVITDTASGFSLPAALLSVMGRDFECFLYNQ